MAEAAAAPETDRRVVLVGQPNVGKSALFHALTGRYATCSNVPGTTVTIMRGRMAGGSRPTEIVDTPGILDLYGGRVDHRVAREALLEDAPMVVLVADAKAPHRSLALARQLAELRLPMVVALNMADEATPAATDELARQLDCPVVVTSAVHRRGLGELQAALETAPVPARPAATRQAEELAALIDSDFGADGSSHVVARLLLAGLPEGRELLERRLSPARSHLVERRARELRAEPAARRATVVGDYDAPAPESSAARRRNPALRWLELASIHPVAGPVLTVATLGLLWVVVGWFGAQVLVGWLEEGLIGSWLLPPVTELVATSASPAWLQELLVGEYGLLSMAIPYAIGLVLPVVTTFFLALGVLEDSGYLPRLAVMSSRSLRGVGLSGQALLPLVMGLGCDTMATLGTRVLESRKERIIATLLLALGIPCSAQLAVLLAVGALSAPWMLPAVLATVALQLLLVGHLAHRLLPGRSAPLLVDLPPLRRPRLDNLFVKTKLRVVWYLREVVPLFIIATLLLFVVDALGGLAALEAAAAPVVTGLLGLPQEAATVLLMGFVRRDYGAAGLHSLHAQGALDPLQTFVALLVITLFVPCIANVLVIVRERGWRAAVAIVGVVLPWAILAGTTAHWIGAWIVGGSP